MELAKKREVVEKIVHNGLDYLNYTNELNECAYTDSMLENVIKWAEELKKVY